MRPKMKASGDSIFEFRDGLYVACIFWTAFEADRAGDMLGVLSREPDADHFVFRYRHRWYVDAKVWDSADEKSVYDIALTGTEEAAAQKILVIWNLALSTWPGGAKVFDEPRIIWVRSDRAEDQMRALAGQPFVSVRAAGISN